MYLALRELARARARFGLLVAAVALLVFLILTQQTLQAGLIDSFGGASARSRPPSSYSPWTGGATSPAAS
jgi:putative ABC transport system permease protein